MHPADPSPQHPRINTKSLKVLLFYLLIAWLEEIEQLRKLTIYGILGVAGTSLEVHWFTHQKPPP